MHWIGMVESCFLTRLIRENALLAFTNHRSSQLSRSTNSRNDHCSMKPYQKIQMLLFTVANALITDHRIATLTERY